MSTNIRLGYVIYYVPDVSKTLQFYEKAFQLSRRFLHESETYGELDTGATALAFVSESLPGIPGGYHPNRQETPPAAVEIGLVTDDVAALYQHAVQHGAFPLQDPLLKPWGQTVAYVKDCNGCLVELCSPIQ